MAHQIPTDRAEQQSGEASSSAAANHHEARAGTRLNELIRRVHTLHWPKFDRHVRKTR